MTARVASEAIVAPAPAADRRGEGHGNRRRKIELASLAVSAADIIGSAVLVWRALAWPGSSGLPTPLFVSRIALSSLLGAWALVYLSWAVHPVPSAISSFVLAANKHACIVIASWSAAAGAADILAGAGPVALFTGLVIASLYGWDRPRRTSVLSISASLICAASSLAASSVGERPVDLESLALIAVSAGCAAAIAYTIRSYVAPGRELLRTLELENRQLWDLSFKDPLTGLYNRRFAQETGRNLFQRARRYREQLYVLMIDIDRFKRVNDELSHARGDEVLKAVAAIIQSCLRSSDSVSRYGGEEFLVYLVQADSQVAQFVANRIRDTIESTAFNGVPWQVTISVGVAGIQDDDALDTLVARADRYLYAAKRGGRNRVSGF